MDLRCRRHWPAGRRSEARRHTPLQPSPCAAASVLRSLSTRRHTAPAAHPQRTGSATTAQQQRQRRRTCDCGKRDATGDRRLLDRLGRLAHLPQLLDHAVVRLADHLRQQLRLVAVKELVSVLDHVPPPRRSR